MQRLPHLCVVGIGFALEQRDRAHHHPGRAIPTLKGPDLEESLLDRVEHPADSEPLDGPDGPAGDLGQVQLACPDRLAVEQHGAGAACALAASGFRAREAQLVAQDEQQGAVGSQRDGAEGSVDDERGGGGWIDHGRTSAEKPDTARA
jgi:hypothetical protein